MCGIVGAVSTRNIVPVLVEGLKRLEYRGYDSCGVAVHQGGELRRARSTSRVAELEAGTQRDGVERRHRHRAHPLGHARRAGGAQRAPALLGRPGGGRPSTPASAAWTASTRPPPLRASAWCTTASSRTTTSCAPSCRRAATPSPARPTPRSSPTWSTTSTTATCSTPCSAPCPPAGAYAIAVFCRDEPQRVVGARAGSPLVLGVGQGENFLASDAMALAGVTDQIVYLEEGDVVDLQLGKVWISARDANGRFVPVERPVRTVQAHSGAAELGPYRHYMQKEIFEQPRAIADTLEGVAGITPELFGDKAPGGSSRHRPRAHPGLRHQLLQRQHRALLAGEHRRHPDHGGDRQRVPLPRQRARPAHAGRHHQPERRDGRHHRRAQARAQPGHGAHADHLQRGHQRHGARMRAGLHHARRRRDRRGQHQGLHHPAGRPVPADAGAGAGARPADRRRGSRPPEGAAPPAGGGAGGAGAGAAGHRLERGVRAQARTRSSWAAACTTRSRSKARSSSRRSATSTPRPTRPASSSTARWPW
jgi:hypothetical protein